MAWDRGSKLGSCCYECSERHEACHDSCPKYIEAKKMWDEKQAAIREYKERDVFFYGYKMDRIKGMSKSKNIAISKKRGRI